MNSGESMPGYGVGNTPDLPPSNESTPSLSPSHNLLPQPSERLFQALFEAAIDAMIIVDDGYYLIAVNAAACQLYQRSPEALIGRHGADFITPTCDTHDNWQQRLQAAPVSGETGIVQPDQTVRHVEYTLTANFVPQCHLLVMRASFPANTTIQPQPLASGVASSNDQWQPSPPQLATLELQQALEFEALLKRITDSVRDSLDEAQILQTAVQALTNGLGIDGCDVALYNFAQQVIEIWFESSLATMPPLRTKTVPMSNDYDLLEQLLRGDTFQFCRIEPMAVRQIERWFTVLNSPLVDNQQVIGGLWLFKPCDQSFSPSEIRLSQQVANQCAIAIRQARLYQAAQAQVTELERLNRLKDDFLSSVSHELRTPVASIKMAAQMLEILLVRNTSTHVSEDPETTLLALSPSTFQRMHQYLQILNNECQREINLITNLLDITRFDAQSDPLLPIDIDLQIWLPHVVEPFIETMQNHQQQLRLDLPTDLPTVTTDLSYLQRILSELLTNANKYTPSGETITVAAAVSPLKPGTIQIRVTNTGVHIPPPELPRIFDKFYRIPNNDPWRYGGTGLGLALVQKIATRLQATITAESHNDSVTFILDLPLQLMPAKTPVP